MILNPLTLSSTIDCALAAGGLAEMSAANGLKIRPFGRPDAFLKRKRICSSVAATAGFGDTERKRLEIANVRKPCPKTGVSAAEQRHRGPEAREMLSSRKPVSLTERQVNRRISQSPF